MLRRMLDGFEEAALSLVRIIFLLSGATAVAAYFGGKDVEHTLQALVHGDITTLIPWALALAFEVFMYAMARNVAKSWHGLQSPVLDAVTKRSHRNGLFVYGAVLFLAVAFSMWNQVNFLIETWHPTVNTVLPTPEWLQYLIRAVSTPMFFMFTAFLAPPPQTISEEINGEARHILQKFTGLLRKQTKKQIKLIEGKTDLNMGDAINAVAKAAGEGKAGATIASVQGAMADILNDKPAEDITIVPVTSGKPGDVEARARKLYRPNMTPAVLADRAKINIKTARKYVKKFEAELKRGPRLLVG